MTDFNPNVIYIDEAVQDAPVTQRILAKFPDLPRKVVADAREIKKPAIHTKAKKQLYLAEHKGTPIKSCQGMGDYVCCQYYTMALVSDCHLECTYCILQDYLKNNPRITVYCNTDAVFGHLQEKAARHPERILRVGTGELSDSLALDHITEFSKDYVAFARDNKNVLLELKTKTNNVQNLLDLDHQKRTIVSWSVNPQKYITKEEFKCATLEERLQAARLCADAGYPVAFHLDPLLYFDNWQDEYRQVIGEIASRFVSKEIAWVSIGSLRFTPDLKKISQERFPKSEIMAGEMFPSRDGKIRYFRPLREEMYAFVKNEVQTQLKKVPHYLCMETKAVWKNVYGEIPKNNSELESYLVQNF